MAGTSHVVGPFRIQVRWNFGRKECGKRLLKRETSGASRDLASQILADRDYPDDIEIEIHAIEKRREGGIVARLFAVYRRMAPEQSRRTKA